LLEVKPMKRLIFLFAVGVVALAAILILIFPSVVLDLIGLMPASLPPPPEGFDVCREGIKGGKVETVEYDSKAAGYTRKMRVYTPPGSSKEQQCPVLYLLHGSLADETSWVKDGRVDAILDNLYADKKAVPMIVVMPNGNLPSTAESDSFGADMLGDVIPYVESHFPVQVGREYRALAGVSAGAHQALDLGLAHPETFAYLGVFIGGLRDCEQFEKKHQDVLKDLGAKMKPKLLWVANCKNDMTYEDCQDTLRLFNKYNIHYIYREGKGLHNWETARNDLFVFAPLVFRDMD
jgi:enterochelin esterase-like enzyme